MKFVFVVNDLKFALSHRSEILYELKRKGFEVNIICFKNKNTIPADQSFTIHEIDSDMNSQNIFEQLKVISLYYKIIKKIKPDLVHLVTIKPVLFGGLVMLFFKKIPTLFSIPGFGSLFTKKGIIDKIKLFLVKLLYALVLIKKKKIIIVQSKQNYAELMSICKLKKDDISLIRGSGVDLSYYNFQPIKERKTFLFASRLLVQKGVEDFYRASLILKGLDNEIKLKIAGGFEPKNPDSISQELFNKINDDKNIEYLGELKCIKKDLSASTCLVLPTYYGEGVPKVLIEANALGRPVITTDISGCKDFLIDGKNGLFVEPKNPDDIANKILKISKNVKMQDEMALFSNNYARKNFDVNQVVSLHVQLYQKLIYEKK